MFHTRNRYKQPTLKAQKYSKGMAVVRELMTGIQDSFKLLYRRKKDAVTCQWDLDIHERPASARSS